MENNISASEIIGELRRAARMYEVLKRAEEMVMVLANLEGKERQVKANIAEGEKLLKSFEDKAIEVKSSMDKQRQSAINTVQKMQEEASIVREQASNVLRKAREESSSLVANAKAEVEGMRAYISDLRSETSRAKVEEEAAKAALASVFSEMKVKKEQLLKAFN